MNSPRYSNTQGGYLPGVSGQLHGYADSGLSRKGWQDLVGSYTGMGRSAAAAAHNINPYYQAQNETGYNNNGGYTSGWQAAVADVAETYGVAANDAAEALAPYWPGGKTARTADQSNFTRGLSQAQRNQIRNVAQYYLQQEKSGRMSRGYSNMGYNGSTRGRFSPRTGQYYGATSLGQKTPLSPAANPNIVDMTMRQLGAQYNPQTGKYYGLDKTGYQVALSELTGKGTSATQAAQLLDQVYDSQTERPTYTAKQWQNAISQYSDRTGASASQAAQALGANYLAPGESARFQISNPRVTGYSNQATGAGVYGPTPEGLRSPYGMYGGLTGHYPAGTPARPGDVVLNSAQSNVLQALQSANPENYPSMGKPTQGYLNESDVRRIAGALGLSTEGNRTKLVADIKNRVRQMSPQAQQQFMGGLSPRSQQLMTGSPGNSPRGLQTL